jgi:hypothetical protein
VGLGTAGGEIVRVLEQRWRRDGFRLVVVEGDPSAVRRNGRSERVGSCASFGFGCSCGCGCGRTRARRGEPLGVGAGIDALHCVDGAGRRGGREHCGSGGREQDRIGVYKIE